MDLTDLVFIDSAGYHYADYPTFLLWRTQQYQNIYGADVYLQPDSMDGQLLAAQAQSDYDTAALGAAIYSSFSPVTAQGAGLSRLVKINGLAREVSSNSTADLTVVGVAGTQIINGIAQDTQQQMWNLPASVIIPGGGSIVVTATAQVTGALTANANTITTIFTPTLGWQTVNNVAAATPGAPVESDGQLRARQIVSTANPSLTVLEGTNGALANLAGVVKTQVYENDTGTTDSNGLPPHSISAVVAGGDVQDIANTIALHKTPGCNTYGTTSEVTYDSRGLPLTINFYRPTVAEITCTVTISVNTQWSADYILLIQAAVAAQVNALPIGSTVYISSLYAPAGLYGTIPGASFVIASLTIGLNSGMQGTSDIALDFNDEAVTNPLVDVTVVIS